MDYPTLAEIRESVRGKLDDDSYEASAIDEAANDFQNDIFMNHRIRTMETSDTVSVSAGDTTMALPDDFQTVIRMFVADGARSYDITENYIDYNSFMNRFANFADASSAAIHSWTDYGNGLRFSAPVLADSSVLVDYLRVPKYMKNDSSKFEISMQYRELCVLGTLARVMERDEDYDVAAVERNKLDGLVTAFVRNMGRGQIKTGPNVIRTRRRTQQQRDW